MVKHKAWIGGVERVRGDRDSRFDWLRLDKNERVTPFPDAFLESVLRKLRVEHITAYPETEYLYEKLAAFLHLKPSQLMLTAESDAAIEHAFSVFVNPDDAVVTLRPTFAMVDVYCRLYGARQIPIGYDSDLNVDFQKLLGALDGSVSLVVVANPNSPTGTYIPVADIQKLLAGAARLNIPVLVDEAYYGFCKQTVLPLIQQYENLIVARTFSKAAGLAGARIGYLAAEERLAQLLYRFRPMYEVNSLGILLAAEILDHPHWVNDYLLATEAGRSYLRGKLSGMSVPFRDTFTNFIHIDFQQHKAAAQEQFERRKVIVRGGLPIAGFENYLRVTLGPEEAMRPVVEVIADVYRYARRAAPAPN